MSTFIQVGHNLRTAECCRSYAYELRNPACTRAGCLWNGSCSGAAAALMSVRALLIVQLPLNGWQGITVQHVRDRCECSTLVAPLRVRCARRREPERQVDARFIARDQAERGVMRDRDGPY